MTARNENPRAQQNRGRIQNLTNAGKGRPKGAPNKATVEAKEACRALVQDPAYLRRFKARLHQGTLAPGLEAMVWHYAHGKPTESVDVRDGGLSALAQAIREDMGEAERLTNRTG